MLTAKDVETAFVQAAGEQVNGEEFNWSRVAELLNHKIGKPGRVPVDSHWTFAR